MQRWIVLLIIVSSFMVSNAWAWDNHGHHFVDADPAHVLASDDGEKPLSGENDHGCHANAHFLAILATDLANSHPVLHTAFTADFAAFVSLVPRPLIDPPIA